MSHAIWDVDPSPEPVDIVVVTYNRIRYLEECVRSILANTTYPYGKLIVVDNHSQDGTRAWLKEQAAQDRLVPVFLKENRGRVEGLNAGIETSDCEIVAISDDDTRYGPGWLTVCMRILELWPEVSVASADHRRIGQYVKTECREGVTVLFRTSLRRFHLVFRRSVVERAGGMKMPHGQLLGSGFPFKKLHEMGEHAAKFTLCPDSDENRKHIGLLVKPYTELGNAEAEGLRYVEHMANPSGSRSHHDYYAATGYKEFARRAKLGKLGGDREFTPADVRGEKKDGS